MGPVPAQPDPPADSWRDRVRAIGEELGQSRVRPLVGVVVAGSGLAVGAELVVPCLRATTLGIEIDGEISVRDYRTWSVRAGWLARRRHAAEMAAPDASLSSLFGDPRTLRPGRSLYLEHRWRRLPRLPVFGAVRPAELARADFGQADASTDLLLHWQRVNGLGLSLRFGRLSTSLFPGTHDQDANVDVAFGHLLAAHHWQPTRFVVAGAGVSFDRRDPETRATRGVRVDGLVRRYASQDRAPSFTRAAVDIRGYHAISRRHVLAGRVLASVMRGDGGRGLPFYLMDALGGTRTLRGFESYRMRGERLLALSVETRLRAHDRVEVVPFLDAGAVGRRPLPGIARGLLLTPGIGIRGRTASRVLVRADVAYARHEGVRLALDVAAPF